MLGCVHATWTAGCRPQQCGIEITLPLLCSKFQNSVQVWVGGKFELPVIETGARGAEKWLEPKWHQFTTAPKRVSITYEQSRPPLRLGWGKIVPLTPLSSVAHNNFAWM